MLTVRDLTIDVPRRRVMLAGSEVKLSQGVRALALLAQHPGRILTHQQLLREV